MAEDFWDQRGDGSWKGDSLDALSTIVHDNGRPKSWVIVVIVALVLIPVGLFLGNLWGGSDAPSTPEPTVTATATATPEPTPTETPVPEVTQLILTSFGAQWSSADLPGCKSSWTASAAGWSSILVENKTRAALESVEFTVSTNWTDSGFALKSQGDNHGNTSVALNYDKSTISLCVN